MKRTIIFPLVLALLTLGSRCPGQQPLAEESPAAQESTDEKRYDLLAEYAKKNKQLAEIELQRAIELRKRSPGVIAKLTVERLRSNLAVAEQQYTEATLASIGGLDRVRRRHAEEKVRVARLAFEKRQAGHQDRIGKLEMQRLQLKYELAKLNLELLDHPERFVTLLYHLEAKINQLGEEILSLDQRLTTLEPIL